MPHGALGGEAAARLTEGGGKVGVVGEESVGLESNWTEPQMADHSAAPEDWMDGCQTGVDAVATMRPPAKNTLAQPTRARFGMTCV